MSSDSRSIAVIKSVLKHLLFVLFNRHLFGKASSNCQHLMNILVTFCGTWYQFSVLSSRRGACTLYKNAFAHIPLHFLWHDAITIIRSALFNDCWVFNICHIECLSYLKNLWYMGKCPNYFRKTLGNLNLNPTFCHRMPHELRTPSNDNRWTQRGWSGDCGRELRVNLFCGCPLGNSCVHWFTLDASLLWPFVGCM